LFFLVCFDIVEDKKRRQVVKALLSNGVRVQKSVFECPNLSERRFLKMKSKIEDIIDYEVDTCRYYFICRDCIGKMEFSGIGEMPKTELFRVV